LSQFFDIGVTVHKLTATTPGVDPGEEKKQAKWKRAIELAKAFLQKF